MVDIILGMGEVGETMFELLAGRGFDCAGIDSDASRCRNYSEGTIIKNPEYLHVCIPGELEGFAGVVSGWIGKFGGLKAVMVHSTVRPGTTETIQKKTRVPVLFSPVRGVHKRFLEDMKRYTKLMASDGEVDPGTRADLESRFQKTGWMSTSKTVELAKILVDTSYYGWLINYAQVTKMICEKEGVDFDEMWGFADEIHENLGNRPKMYPGVIGGHCVIPNLGLIEYKDLDMIKKINEMYEKFSSQ
ncbi:MAG: GDP-mannose dehydrogenase [Nitrosopumilus sp. H8]|nr:MAG: GDP-mannose dehydrogenase [Nitrosopumilus sp. H8]